MGNSQLEIFATLADIDGVLRAVEEQVPLSFAAMGVFETDTIQRFDSSVDVIRAMKAPGGGPPAFLVVNRTEPVVVREVSQKKGGSRHSVDQLNNPQSIVLRPSGIVEDNTLLAGQIGTASKAPSSVKLFAAFGKAVRRQFVKVKSYWVGPEALQLLDGGGRLTANVRASSDYDLRR